MALDNPVNQPSPYITMEFLFPNYQSFKNQLEDYDVDTSTLDGEKLFKLVFNRYRNRTFKVQSSAQIYARIEDVWNNNLYIRERLEQVRLLDNDQLQQGASGSTSNQLDSNSLTEATGKAFNNSGSKEDDGTATKFLQATDTTEQQNNQAATSISSNQSTKLDKLKLYNQMLELQDEKVRLFRDFSNMFLPFQIINRREYLDAN